MTTPVAGDGQDRPAAGRILYKIGIPLAVLLVTSVSVWFGFATMSNYVEAGRLIQSIDMRVENPGHRVIGDRLTLLLTVTNNSSDKAVQFDRLILSVHLDQRPIEIVDIVARGAEAVTVGPAELWAVEFDVEMQPGQLVRWEELVAAGNEIWMAQGHAVVQVPHARKTIPSRFLVR